MKKKDKIVVIFSEFSKKIGMGHYVRSKRLYEYLKKNFKVFYYLNKSKNFIKYYTSKNSENITYIFDFKNYKNKGYKIQKKCNYLFFDKNQKNKKNVFHLNPLLPWEKKLSGPKWFCYPPNFFMVKKKEKKNKKILICQGGTDAHNNLNTLIRIIRNEVGSIKVDLNVLIPKEFKIDKNLKKKYSIKFYRNIKNMSKFLINFDHIVTSCGSLSYEINSLGISCTYISSEPREIKLAKFLEKKKFGKYFQIKKKNQIRSYIYENLISSNKPSELKNKIRYFRHNGLRNISKLIQKINNEI
jgi:spore coat polysaccharide biosynthesis predicted glycosyltransferase SpsG